VYLEVRVPGRSASLLLACEEGSARLSVVEERPANPPTPPPWQSVLRRELTGCRLRDVEALPLRRTLLLHLTREGKNLTLVLEVGRPPCVVLVNEVARVLAVSHPSREGLRVGSTWTPPAEGQGVEAASRLESDHQFLRLAHGAEALFGAQEVERWRSRALKPLEKRLERLRRTREKVEADAARTEEAQGLREEGELLTQNLHRLKRGAPSISLTEYLADGSTRERAVTLDPRRTPKEEVEHRFHQYKRLLRGAEFASRRREMLAREEAELVAKLAALAEAEPGLPAAPSRAKAEAPSLPYREYRGHGGARILVGRGAAHNDELTFKVALPHHVWLHARGVPGAHVVVPLEKRETLNQELLLDAAHLAAWHSDAKGEPRVEVSSTTARYVKKPKGAAPGAVTYTREKTFLLRVDQPRLDRLLASLFAP
jgi:predicted ribosome quality control (RQC) complex YloA/Tae2 family protein